MTETTQAIFDRYMNGEATLDEQQVLAREALRDPDLFDLLTAVDAAKAALRDDPSLLPTIEKVQSSPRRYFMWAGVAAAAAVAVLAVWYLAWPLSKGPEPTQVVAGSNEGGGGTSTAVIPHPAFLSARLDLPEGKPGPSFRGVAGARAMAADEGVIQSVEAGAARVDLGLLDGLVVGATIEIEADPALKFPAETAKVTATFRDRARLAVGPNVKEGRRVRVSATVHLRALSTLLTDATAAGDAELARAAATRASTVARGDAAGADLRREVLVKLAALARRRNDPAATEKYLREAAALLESAPPAAADDRGEILNALGVVLAANGKFTEADATLRQAQQAARPDGTVAGQILNNLGALAAIRRDLVGARALYLSALALMPASADQSRRVIVESNLAQIGRQR